MKLLVVPLLILLIVPACQLTPSKKTAKTRKTVETVKRQPLVVLIAPELVGRECVVEERVDDEKVTRTYTGKLIRFNDDVIVLESPRLETKTERERPLLGALGKSVAVAGEELEEDKVLGRVQIASIRPVTSPAE